MNRVRLFHSCHYPPARSPKSMFLLQFLVSAILLIAGVVSDSDMCRTSTATATNDRTIMDNCGSKSNSSTGCTYKNHTIALNEYFNDGCDKLCFCTETELICRDKKCPLTDNLQNIDPECTVWQKLPVDFVPQYPNCCQQDAVCVSNGSCVYREADAGTDASGTFVEHWAELPETLSGCERKCYCEQSRFECHEGCPLLRVTQSGAPGWLSDDDGDDDGGDNTIRLFECDRTISIRKSDEDSCCIEWSCIDQKELEDSLRNVFIGDEFIEFKGSLPNGVLRLKGSVKAVISILKNSTFVKSSEQTIRKNSVFTMQKIETKLEPLVADADHELELKIELVNYNLTVNWTRLTFRTHPKSVQYASGLRVIAVTANSIAIEWRSLTDYDLQLFAGVRLEFREEDDDDGNNNRPFLETALFVNDNENRYRLRNLNANRTYLIRLVLVSGTGHDSIVARNYLRAKTSAETHQNSDKISQYGNWTGRLIVLLLAVVLACAVVYLVRYKRKYKARISSTMMTTPTTMMSSLSTF